MSQISIYPLVNLFYHTYVANFNITCWLTLFYHTYVTNFIQYTLRLTYSTTLMSQISIFTFKRYQLRSYRMNANGSSINIYIYIFPHNLCKMQVFNLVFDSQILHEPNSWQYNVYNTSFDSSHTYLRANAFQWHMTHWPHMTLAFKHFNFIYWYVKCIYCFIYVIVTQFLKYNIMFSYTIL